MVMRNYSKEYREYHAKPGQRKNRSKRNSARRLMRKKLGEGRIRGKDIDHKDKNPRNNSRRNLRVLSKSINRSVR